MSRDDKNDLIRGITQFFFLSEMISEGEVNDESDESIIY